MDGIIGATLGKMTSQDGVGFDAWALRPGVFMSSLAGEEYMQSKVDGVVGGM